MHQSVADPKYDGVRTSRKELMEDDEEHNSEDSEESHHDEDEEDSGEEEEQSKEGRVRFDIPSEKQSRKSNGAISDEDITSESEDGSELSQRGDRNITSNPNISSRQQSENLEPTEDISSTLKKKREEDLEKGQAVKRQVVCPFYLRNSVCMTFTYRRYGTHYSIPEYDFRSLSSPQTNFRRLVLLSMNCISFFFLKISSLP